MREPNAEDRLNIYLSGKVILLCHVLLAIAAISFYPFLLWSQVAIAGFWLALGKGSIWRRLFWVAVELYALGVFFPFYYVRNEFFSALLWTIAFTCIFAGIGIIVLGQNPQWTKLRVQFRFWELLAGTASLGFAFIFVKHQGEFDRIPYANWRDIYYVFIHSSLIGLGTAAIGMILMTQPGLPKIVVLCVAVLLTVLIPFIDYLACQSLRIELFDAETRIYFYLSNLAIVWITVLLYQNAIRSGDPMIFETSESEPSIEEPD